MRDICLRTTAMLLGLFLHNRGSRPAASTHRCNSQTGAQRFLPAGKRYAGSFSPVSSSKNETFLPRGRKPLACWIILIGVTVAGGAQTSIPSRSAPVPAGFGINTHVTDPTPGELDELAGAGLRWNRIDLGWSSTEVVKGVYDFSAYDGLLASLNVRGVHALFILGETNHFYDNGLAPFTSQGRAGFVQWAAAAVQHFRGNGIIWELYNEPNLVGGGWTPQPNVANYVLLAAAVGTMFSSTGSTEAFVGPAAADTAAGAMDFQFLRSCFQGGLLNYFSAITVHPYRQVAPESVAADYYILRQLIAEYAPPGKEIPILSGEWGYSTGWQGISEDIQAKYLARQ
jgi:hypothetical protein